VKELEATPTPENTSLCSLQSAALPPESQARKQKWRYNGTDIARHSAPAEPPGWMNISTERILFMNNDLEQIKILSIFHYIVAAFAAAFACFPIFHLAMGISMLTGGLFNEAAVADPDFPFALFGIMFTLIPAIIIVFGWVFAICLAVAGWFLSSKQHYLFCMVMAGISCIFTPFGTVLGIFTIIVLIRPTVKALFAGKNATQPA
jgi:hypothetical protein